MLAINAQIKKETNEGQCLFPKQNEPYDLIQLDGFINHHIMMGWMENKPCSFKIIQKTKKKKKIKKKVKYKEDKHESLLYNISM